MNSIILSLIVLGGIGLISALILYYVLAKFKVDENPYIDKVEALLPGANCGGCSFAGCRNFAEKCVSSESMDGLFCPVGKDETMQSIAKLLGKSAQIEEPKIAVVRCQGSCDVRPRTNIYDGVTSCKIANTLYIGESGCPNGCLGYGDCEFSCPFDSIHIDLKTNLPVVDEDLCTACGKCVVACPRDIIQIRRKGPKNRRIYVSCINQEKGGIARKSCEVACIGCSKCLKECAFEAITITNNLAYIDDSKCRLCKKCVDVCPTKAIVTASFPIKQVKQEDENV